MADRRIGAVALLLCVCLCLMPLQALAASTSDANEMIATDRACTLTVSFRYGGTAFKDLPVKLYRIADVSADFRYTLTAPFSTYGLALNGIRANSEWNVIRSTLEANIIADRIAADASAVTDQAGQVSFGSLRPGLYLAIPGTGTAGDTEYVFESALVALPGLSTDGRWQYQVAVTAKGAPLPPVGGDSEVSYKILKLWNGDDSSSRPRQIQVEIFRNGESYQTVTLSKDDNWSYTWTTEDDGATWTIAERNVPSGYTATMERREYTFLLTNTLDPEDDPPEVEPPKMGDTLNLLLYMLLAFGSGILLILLGATGRKKRT